LIRRQLPFPLRGIDADNDPVVKNSLMEAWCDRPGHQIVLTRSRAYQSNDQAWVEQKHRMLVRRVVGYQRLEGLEAAQVASGEPSAQAEHDLAAENRSLEVFLGGLQTLGHSSQPKRRKPKPRSGKRTRPDPFEPDVALIEQWLQAEPLIRAKTLMERLIAHNPERYGECHLRTLQRRLRGYRLQQIQKEMEQALEAPYPVEESKGQDEKPVLPGVNQKG